MRMDWKKFILVPNIQWWQCFGEIDFYSTFLVLFWFFVKRQVRWNVLQDSCSQIIIVVSFPVCDLICHSLVHWSCCRCWWKNKVWSFLQRTGIRQHSGCSRTKSSGEDWSSTAWRTKYLWYLLWGRKFFFMPFAFLVRIFLYWTVSEFKIKESIWW